VGVSGEGFWASRFQKLDGKRMAHLNRCRRCAELTIPSLLPPEGADENTPLPTPYQGVGANAVNNLTAKLLLTLMPPNSPFFRMDIDEVELEKLKEDLGDQQVKTRINKKLALLERRAVKWVERLAYRVQLFKAIRLLVVSGNALIEKVLETGKLKIHRLDKYVVRRDGDGNVRELVIREKVSLSDLPEEMRPEKDDPKRPHDEDNIDLFTFAVWTGKQWEYGQEALGKTVPDSEGTAPKGKLPFIVLTWTLADGENYGRGHVEDYLGDFHSLDSLSEALLDGAQLAALVKFLVDPNGMTNIEDVRSAPNGGYAPGTPDDIHALSLDKYADFKTAYEQSIRIEERLSRAFLLVHSIQRNAERVTAEEIRLMAQELEDALGGVYSVLAQELQRPLAELVVDDMRKKNALPPLPAVELTIVTGFDALGRGHDLARLQTFLQNITPMGEQAIQLYINVANYIERVAAALGMDTSGLVKTEEEVAQAQQNGQMMGLLEKLGPQIMKLMQEQGGMGGATEGAAGGQ